MNTTPELLATDVPIWLKNIINKIPWNTMGMLMKPIVVSLVQRECKALPQKKGDYSAYNFETYAPPEVIRAINLVDYTQMSNDVQLKFQTKIETSVKEYLGVKL